MSPDERALRAQALSDPTARAVLEDYLHEQGRTLLRRGDADDFLDSRIFDGYGDGGGNGYGGGHGDGAAGKP